MKQNSLPEKVRDIGTGRHRCARSVVVGGVPFFSSVRGVLHPKGGSGEEKSDNFN